MKISPRHVPMRTAENELLAFLLDLERRHGLTDAEYLALLADAQRSRLTFIIRSERETESA